MGKEDLTNTNNNLIPLFEWKAPKNPIASPYFQVGTLILLLVMSGYLFWQKNYFGVMTLLMAIFLLFISQKGKEELYCAILKEGIRVNNEIFRWENLEGFWIFEGFSEVYLKTKKAFLKNIPIPINKEDSERIRNLMIQFLQEKEIQISLSEIIIKKLGL